MIAIVIGFTIIALIDLVPLLIHRKGRAIVAFLVVFVAASSLAVLKTLYPDMPSTMRPWKDLLDWLNLGYPP